MHYFCTVAEQGQISRAARVLHMAQPPLSQRLRELEEELGTPLFIRQGRALQLTAAGKLFYRRCRDILRATEAAREEIVRAASLTGPTLRIGLSPTCRALWLRGFMALQGRFPEHQIGLVVGDSSYLEHLLLTGQLDVAFMQPPVYPEDFDVHTVAVSATVGVVPPGLVAAEVAALTLAELSRHPLLVLRRSVGIGGYEKLLRAMHDADLAARVAIYSSDAAVLLDLLAQGFAGIAIIPDSEIGPLPAGFRVLPVAVDLTTYRMSLVSRRGDADPAVIEGLLSVWPAVPELS